MYPTLPARRNNLGSVDVVRPPQPNTCYRPMLWHVGVGKTDLGEGMSNKMTEQERKEYEEQVKEFFARGGTITKCETGATSTTDENFSAWKKGPGRPKKESGKG